MIRTDLHTHTTFCDGKNTAAEMAEAAYEKGMECLGFSGHAHTAFDDSYCMTEEGTKAYQAEVLRLKEAYAGQMEIRLGVEQDLYSDADTESYDYVIGSVHYLKLTPDRSPAAHEAAPDVVSEAASDIVSEAAPEAAPVPGVLTGSDGSIFIPVDESAEILKKAADRYFNGDMIDLAAYYFETVSEVAEVTGCDIIGHFDLVSKFNEGGACFDEQDPRYIASWQKAADRLLASGKPFEINTGAITRGYRTSPYPNPDMIRYIKAHGGALILSSDSHSTGSLLFGFDKYSELL